MRKSVTTRFFTGIVSFFLFAGSFSGCYLSRSKPVTRTGFYFDTVVSITIYSPADETLLDSCFELAQYYEDLLSRTKEGSDIYKINHAEGSPVSVSSETILLLETALQYAALTDGKVDPTIGAVSRLWDFHRENEGAPPEELSIQEALSHVDYRCVQISGNRVTLSDPCAVLDLGFLAKGYIADKIKEYLQNEGVTGALINLGGNVLALGSKPGGKPFTIGIQEPFSDTGTSALTLPVRNSSVVSSGIYERYFEHGGKLFHHILDTSTGYPIENDLFSVTILSESSLTGDALSTACFTMGYEDAAAYINTLNDIEAIFITYDKQIHTTY